MIDIHIHILPGIDDGSDNIEEALEIAREMVKQGYSKVAATPHYPPEGYKLTPEDIKEKVRRLQEEIDRQGLELEVLPGAEVYLTPDLCQHLVEGVLTTINNSRYLLVELPFNFLPAYAEDVLSDIQAAGYFPVISHPERYIYIIEEPELLYSWINNGCYAQLNTGSLTGVYGPEVRRTAGILLEHRLVHLIGSDVHSPSWKRGRPEDALAKLKKITGADISDFLRNAESLIRDKELITAPPLMIRKKGFLSRIRAAMKSEKLFN